MNTIVTLNTDEHKSIIEDLKSGKDFLSSSLDILRARESACISEYESLLSTIEMLEETLLKVNNVMFEISVP